MSENYPNINVVALRLINAEIDSLDVEIKRSNLEIESLERSDRLAFDTIGSAVAMLVAMIPEYGDVVDAHGIERIEWTPDEDIVQIAVPNPTALEDFRLMIPSMPDAEGSIVDHATRTIGWNMMKREEIAKSIEAARDVRAPLNQRRDTLARSRTRIQVDSSSYPDSESTDESIKRSGRWPATIIRI